MSRNWVDLTRSGTLFQFPFWLLLKLLPEFKNVECYWRLYWQIWLFSLKCGKILDNHVQCITTYVFIFNRWTILGWWRPWMRYRYFLFRWIDWFDESNVQVHLVAISYVQIDFFHFLQYRFGNVKWSEYFFQLYFLYLILDGKLKELRLLCKNNIQEFGINQKWLITPDSFFNSIQAYQKSPEKLKMEEDIEKKRLKLADQTASLKNTKVVPQPNRKLNRKLR